METDSRFKDNWKLEMVMRNLFGSKHYYGTAGAFSDVEFTKKCLLRAVKRIRDRLDEIPMDEFLIQNVGRILDGLEGDVKQISESENGDWVIIADLFDLIVHLVGYDWYDGKVHRSIIYFQDRAQEQEDWKMQAGREPSDMMRLEDKHRMMLVNQLMKSKLPKYHIAWLLGLSTERVNKILRAIAVIEKEGKKIPSFAEEVE